MKVKSLIFHVIKKYAILYMSLNAWIEKCNMCYKSWAYPFVDKPFSFGYAINRSFFKIGSPAFYYYSHNRYHIIHCMQLEVLYIVSHHRDIAKLHFLSA